MIRVVVLDRDGTLNVDVGYTFRIEDLQLAPGVIEGLKLFSSMGFVLVIATGQSGISKGMYTEDDMKAFNDKLVHELEKHGIKIEAVVFCPHDKGEGCNCRKPQTGMLDQLEEKVGPIDWANSVGVGDKPSDAQMILSKGGLSILLTSGTHNNTAKKNYWDEADPAALDSILADPRNWVAPDLGGAALTIERQLEEQS